MKPIYKILIVIGLLIASYLIGFNVKGYLVRKELAELDRLYSDTILMYQDSLLSIESDLAIKDAEISNLNKELSKNREYLNLSLNLIGKQTARQNYEQVQGEIQHGNGKDEWCFDSVEVTDINLKLTDRKFLLRDTTIMGEIIGKYKERIEITNNQKQYFLDLTNTYQRQNTSLRQEVEELKTVPLLSFELLNVFARVSNPTNDLKNIKEASYEVGLESNVWLKRRVNIGFSVFYGGDLTGQLTLKLKAL
jgi:hypothetical protein